MTIAGTVQLSGRVKYVPPVPTLDSSSNPAWLSDLLEQMPCSARKEEEYTLTADGDTAVNFGSLVSGANLVIVKVMPNIGLPPSATNPNGVAATPNPITVKLTGGAGAAQGITCGFVFLLSADIAYTAMTIARAAGMQTTVRVQLFALGS